MKNSNKKTGITVLMRPALEVESEDDGCADEMKERTLMK